jgi:hypothetical protein
MLEDKLNQLAARVTLVEASKAIITQLACVMQAKAV